MQEKPAANDRYNKQLKVKSKQLRSNMTKVEACLWKYVLTGINGVYRKIEGWIIESEIPPPNPRQRWTQSQFD